MLPFQLRLSHGRRGIFELHNGITHWVTHWIHTEYTLGNIRKRGIYAPYILWPCILPLYAALFTFSSLILKYPLSSYNLYLWGPLWNPSAREKSLEARLYTWTAGWREKHLCWNGLCKWSRFLTEKHLCGYRRKNHNSWWEKSLEAQLHKSTRFLPQKTLAFKWPLQVNLNQYRFSWRSQLLLPVKKPQDPCKIWWLSNEHKDGSGQNWTSTLQTLHLRRNTSNFPRAHFQAPKLNPKVGLRNWKGNKTTPKSGTEIEPKNGPKNYATLNH